MLGIDFADGAAAAGGGYLTRNFAGVVKRVLPGLAEQVDRFRPGLSTGVAEWAGAGVVHWLFGQFWREYRRAAVIGASAVAFSDSAAAFIGQLDLLAGHPTLPLPGFAGLGLGAGASVPAGKTAPPGTAALPGPTGLMQGALPAPGASGVPGVPVPTAISLLGYGSYGY